MLEVKDLEAGYGQIGVLHGISLTVGANEFVGILGHNGMGKSTLLKTLIGLLPANGGSIGFGGRDLTRTPPHVRARSRIGYVPQGRGILPRLSVEDNLLFAAAAVGADPRRINDTLADFPRLRSYLGRPGGALSGGEQQLLALARTLIQKPALILLDEPTEGIQPSIIEEIADKLKELRARGDLAVLLVEQNIDFIRGLSDRVLMLQRGQITAGMVASELTDAVAMGDFSAIQH